LNKVGENGPNGTLTSSAYAGSRFTPVMQASSPDPTRTPFSKISGTWEFLDEHASPKQAG
jgi:hypothetical protein